MTFWKRALVSGFFSGYSPMAPGSAGSAVAWVLLWLLCPSEGYRGIPAVAGLGAAAVVRATSNLCRKPQALDGPSPPAGVEGWARALPGSPTVCRRSPRILRWTGFPEGRALVPVGSGPRRG